MRKVLSLMLLLATLFTFTACSSDDDEQKNGLNGTIWTSIYGDAVWVLEFTGRNTVEFYTADNNLNIDGDTYQGTYSVNNNAIKFNLQGAYYQKLTFKKGEISGNSMKVEYDYTPLFSEKTFSTDCTFRKR